MKHIYFTPGPSQMEKHIPFYVRQAIEKNIPSLSHRGKFFEELYHSCIDSLHRLLSIPSSHSIFFVSSGTEAMERILENCVERYSHHFVNGSFSERFYKTSLELGKKPSEETVAFGDSFDFQKVKIPQKTELICFTQNETSTGVALHMQDIYTVKNSHQDMLVGLDIVSSTPYIDVDYSLIDCTFFSVQKGFGLPAGLGVLIIGPRAIKKAQSLVKKNSIGSYHSFVSLAQYAEKNQTPETPNVLQIFLFDKIIKEYLKIGIKNIRKDTEVKAETLYTFFDSHKYLQPFITNRYNRSQTVLTITTKGNSNQIIKKLQKKGFVVGEGYGKYKDTQIRIANFPTTSSKNVEKLLRSIEKIS